MTLSALHEDRLSDAARTRICPEIRQAYGGKLLLMEVVMMGIDHGAFQLDQVLDALLQPSVTDLHPESSGPD